MPTWRFRWSQCVIFTGPIFEVTSEAWRCTPTMLRRAAWTCKRSLAGRGMHSYNKVPAKHNHARSWCCCSLELTCRLLWASFQFTPRSWKSSVLLRNCSARTWTHALFESWIGENWAEPLPFERAIRPEDWLESLSVRDKTKRSCTTVARFQTWCPHLQRKHPSKVVAPTVVTSLGFSCHPPLLQLRLSLYLSLSLFVALWVLSSYYSY